MIRKVSLGMFVAMLLLALLTAVVMAQQPQVDSSPEEIQPSIEPLETSVTQAVPVTLTVNVPGPDGVQVVEIPVVINLEIQIGISSELTASVQATTSVVIPDVPSEEEVVAEKTPAAVSSAATPTATTAAPTATTATTAPVATTAPTETATPTEVAVVTPECADPRAMITSPGVGQVVSATIDIMGTATHENFEYYKVEYAQGADVDPGEEFAYLADANTPVEDGLLAVFSSEDFADGAYTLKLTVVDRTGNFPPPCMVTVMVEN